jgi:hypothetical protein
VLVAVTGFGSLWRNRLGRVNNSGRVTQAVYYNTTGVLVNGNVRQRPKICGYARFDVVGGFDPNHPLRMIHRVFECAEPSVWMGCNKLLFRRLLTTKERPDRYLVIARSSTYGPLRVGNGQWRSPDGWLIAFSEDGGQQEAMLLLGSNGWIQTDLGIFVLATPELRAWEARFVFRGAAD